MRRFILTILALATLLPSLAQAYDILVLQSRRDPGYEEALKGFRAGQPASQRTIILSDYAEIDVGRLVREDHPALILAVGDAALTAARKVRNTPVLTIMSLGSETGGALSSNLTSISMLVPPDNYFNLFNKMHIFRVGVIHSNAISAAYLRKAREAARHSGIELEEREITSSRETIGQLQGMKGKVDVIWMLPDRGAVTHESSEAYFRAGQEFRIPVISFASSYLSLGAAAVFDIDRTALGRQAAALAGKILAGEVPAARQTIPSSGFTLRTNSSVARLLGLKVP
jgi:putative ABC transport system substrate-binding protein